MGTVERGESNLSFQNIVKVAQTLGVSLAVLFADLESAAEKLKRAGPVPPRAKKTSDK
jgi:hypothetical protein